VKVCVWRTAGPFFSKSARVPAEYKNITRKTPADIKLTCSAAQITDGIGELGKTSGFERLYARVTKLYFGGMLRHLLELRPFLRPGAQLAWPILKKSRARLKAKISWHPRLPVPKHRRTASPVAATNITNAEPPKRILKIC
jgi:hypothetical protein